MRSRSSRSVIRKRVLTAWPASRRKSQPYLGYVKRPLRVVRIEDFSLDEVAGAAEQRSRFDVALVFSTVRANASAS